jgi:hypothetical protein
VWHFTCIQEYGKFLSKEWLTLHEREEMKLNARESETNFWNKVRERERERERERPISGTR